MEKLIGLAPEDFIHPVDKQALDKLKNNVLFRKIMAEIIHQGVERMYRIQYTGSCLKIDRDDYPEIYQVLDNCVQTLGVPEDLVPTLYTQYDYFINAFTTGEKEPLMVVYSGTLDLLDQAEQQYVIGHELGHILAHHVLYHMIVNSLVHVVDLGIVTTAIELPMFYWLRMSEFSADRAGLLATQDLEASIRAMIKMAGLPQSQYDKINVQAFIDQAHDFDQKNTGILDETVKFLSIAYSNHPWLVMRAAELLKWVESGEYDRILREKKTISCPHCDNTIPAGIEICPVCGLPH